LRVNRQRILTPALLSYRIAREAARLSPEAGFAFFPAPFTIKGMCGRFTLKSIERLKSRFTSPLWKELSQLPDLAPRYNIAPTQSVLTVTGSQKEPELQLMVWGLIPSWSREPTCFINARSETLDARRSFRESFARRRCLIPADGFYEWRRLGKTKQPFYFQLKDETPFAFAGIWDEWRDSTSETKTGVKPITSCSIITTAPNELLASIHDRMPVILPPDAYDTWLREDAGVDELKEWLAPFPAEEMKSFPVSDRVNYVRIDEPDLVDPVEVKQAAQGTLF
jgi:putative SOS response-associated peptidase YedK